MPETANYNDSFGTQDAERLFGPRPTTEPRSLPTDSFGTQDAERLFGPKPITPEKKPSELRGVIAETASALGAGVVSTAEGLAATAEMIGIPGGETVRKKMQEVGESDMLRRPEYLQEGTVLEHPERLTDWRWWVRSLGENAPNMAAMMLPGVGAARGAQAIGWGAKALRVGKYAMEAPRAAGLAGAWAGSMSLEAGSAYGQAKDEMTKAGIYDADTIERIATLEGVTAGTVNSLIELLPFDNLFLKQAGADRFLKRIVRQTFLEGSTESAQEAVNIYVEKLGHKPEQTLADNIGRILESGIIGGALGGAAGGTIGTYEHRRNVQQYNALGDQLGVKDMIFALKDAGTPDQDIAVKLDTQIQESRAKLAETPPGADALTGGAEVKDAAQKTTIPEVDAQEMVTYLLYGDGKYTPPPGLFDKAITRAKKGVLGMFGMRETIPTEAERQTRENSAETDMSGDLATTITPPVQKPAPTVQSLQPGAGTLATGTTATKDIALAEPQAQATEQKKAAETRKKGQTLFDSVLGELTQEDQTRLEETRKQELLLKEQADQQAAAEQEAQAQEAIKQAAAEKAAVVKEVAGEHPQKQALVDQVMGLSDRVVLSSVQQELGLNVQPAGPDRYEIVTAAGPPQQVPMLSLRKLLADKVVANYDAQQAAMDKQRQEEIAAETARAERIKAKKEAETAVWALETARTALGLGRPLSENQLARLVAARDQLTPREIARLDTRPAVIPAPPQSLAVLGVRGRAVPAPQVVTETPAAIPGRATGKTNTEPTLQQAETKINELPKSETVIGDVTPEEVAAEEAKVRAFVLDELASQIKDLPATGWVSNEEGDGKRIRAGGWISRTVKTFGRQSTTPLRDEQGNPVTLGLSKAFIANVIDKARAGKPLTGQQQAVHDEILREATDEEAYARRILDEEAAALANSDFNPEEFAGEEPPTTGEVKPPVEEPPKPIEEALPALAAEKPATETKEEPTRQEIVQPGANLEAAATKPAVPQSLGLLGVNVAKPPAMTNEETPFPEAEAKPLRQIVGEFVDQRSAEHNVTIERLKAEGRTSEIPVVSKQVSAIIKMDRMRTYNDEALNGPEGLAKLPKWLQQEFADYRTRLSPSVKQETKRQIVEPQANMEAEPAKPVVPQSLALLGAKRSSELTAEGEKQPWEMTKDEYLESMGTGPEDWDYHAQSGRYDQLVTEHTGVAPYVQAIDNAINEREKSRLLIVEGNNRVPGIRQQEAEEAGRWAYLLDKGEVTQEQFDTWVAQMEKENRRVPPTPMVEMGARGPVETPVAVPVALAPNVNFGGNIEEADAANLVDKAHEYRDTRKSEAQKELKSRGKEGVNNLAEQANTGDFAALYKLDGLLADVSGGPGNLYNNGKWSADTYVSALEKYLPKTAAEPPTVEKEDVQASGKEPEPAVKPTDKTKGSATPKTGDVLSSDEFDALAGDVLAELEKPAETPSQGVAIATGQSAATAPATGMTPAAGGKSLAALGLVVTKGATNTGKTVWNISGNTREHSGAIKSAGGRWYGPKKVWSFYNGDPTRSLLETLGIPITPEVAQNEWYAAGHARFQEGGSRNLSAKPGETINSDNAAAWYRGYDAATETIQEAPGIRKTLAAAKGMKGLGYTEQEIKDIPWTVKAQLEENQVPAENYRSTARTPRADELPGATKAETPPTGKPIPFAAGDKVIVQHGGKTFPATVQAAGQHWASVAPTLSVQQAKDLNLGSTIQVSVDQIKPVASLGTAASEVAKGVASSYDAIAEILKRAGKGPISMMGGGVFDEELYTAIKPHLQATYDHFRAAAIEVKEWMKETISQFAVRGFEAQAILPYIKRFYMEVTQNDLTKGDAASTLNTKEGGVGHEEEKRIPRGESPSGTLEVLEGTPGLDVGKSSRTGAGTLPNGKTESVSGPQSGAGLEENLRINQPGQDNGRGLGSGEPVHPVASGRASGTGQPAGGTSGEVGSRNSEVGGESARRPRTSNRNLGVNTRIEPADVLFHSGKVARINANIGAIELSKQIAKEDRPATPAEQKTLLQFSGWGAVAQDIFNPDFDDYVRQHAENPNNRRYYNPSSYFHSTEEVEKYSEWEDKYGRKLHPLLGGILTDEEWKTAAASTMNAHYTSREVIDHGLWGVARRLGFEGGRVLEPAAGIGHILGLMPADFAGQVQLQGVELDQMSGQILSQLYPNADIQVTGFEKAQGIPDNSVDLVISNFPFGNYPINDNKHPAYSGWSIHNYFFARSVDALRPGGIVIAITSRYTMDSTKNGKTRELLADKADLVGAIRLPNNAFGKNAGTEVTTDIIILRKKTAEAYPDRNGWRTNASVKTGDGKDVQVNEYFAQHPEMVLGTHSLAGTMYRGKEEYTLAADSSRPLTEQIDKAVALLPQGIFTADNNAVATAARERAATGTKEGTLVLTDGKINLVNQGMLVTPAWASDRKKAVQAATYISIRDLTGDLIRTMQEEDATEEDVAALQQRLNRVYDNYWQKYGAFNEPKSGFLADDVEFPLVLALENEVKKPVDYVIREGKNKGETRTRNQVTYAKADIFTKRTLYPFIEPTAAANIEDAVNISLTYKNHISPAYIAQLLGKEKDAVQAELINKELAFLNPADGLLESRSEYLSGNVREKLRISEEQGLEKNASALRGIQPRDLTIDEIYFRLGSEWLPPEVINGFMNEKMEARATATLARVKAGEDEVSRWTVEDTERWRTNAPNYTVWGAEGLSGVQLVEDCLNLHRAEIYDYVTDDSGHEKRVKNQAKSINAQQKQREIQKAFKEYVQEHASHADTVAAVYNREKNNYVVRQYDVPDIEHYPHASHLINLRAHQKGAVSRGLQGSTVFAHAVGTGKTYMYATLAMELRRTGQARKPLIVVQGSTVNQFAGQAKKLYPAARILCPSKQDRTKSERRALLARIATNDYDMIIIPHSFFDDLNVNPEREKAFIKEQLEEIKAAILELGGDPGKSQRSDTPTVKQLHAMLKRKEARLDALKDSAHGIDTIYFDEMGIDAVLVDEAHNYKRGDFSTKMGNVKGLDRGAAAKSFRFLMKARAIQEKTRGKNIYLATGTPVSNTTAELWTLLRYVRPDLLAEFGAGHFDGFASMFGDTTRTLEQTETGEFKDIERFNRYVNGPELIKMWQTAADVILQEDVPGWADMVPKLKGGNIQSVAISRPQDLADEIDRIRQERAEWDQLPGMEKKELSYVPLLLFNRAKQAAIDLRLVRADAVDNPDSKTNRVVREVFNRWEESREALGTQLVFADTYHGPNGFSLYDDIKKKLVGMGIPETQIANITENKYNTDTAKETLFEKVNQGLVRVVIGSTAKLGIGVNVQERLVALHHVDAPMRPMDFEQRNGRILRPGNANHEVEVLAYAVINTLDSVTYDRLQKKQKFINQLLRGKLEGRSFEDPADELQFTFEDLMAVSAGNPLVKKRFELENQIREIAVLEDGYRRKIGHLRTQINQADGQLTRAKDDLAAAEKQKKDVETTFPDNQYKITVGGATYADAKEGRKALQAEIGKAEAKAETAYLQVIADLQKREEKPTNEDRLSRSLRNDKEWVIPDGWTQQIADIKERVEAQLNGKTLAITIGAMQTNYADHVKKAQQLKEHRLVYGYQLDPQPGTLTDIYGTARPTIDTLASQGSLTGGLDGILASIRHVLKGIGERPTELTASIEKQEKNLASMKGEIKKPFEFTDTLAGLKQQYDQVLTELGATTAPPVGDEAETDGKTRPDITLDMPQTLNGKPDGFKHPQYSMENVQPWPADFPKVTLQTNGDKLVNHPDHAAAKQGDIDAAERLVRDLAKRDRMEEIGRKYPDAVIVPVVALEQSGENRIPQAYAEALAAVTGLDVKYDIGQTNKSWHTGAKGLSRLLTRAKFVGNVTPGQSYILVDDMATQGGPLAELRHYIENEGGKVVGITTLAADKGSTQIAITPETITTLERKYDRDELEDILKQEDIAGNLEALTDSEGKYLLKYGTLDALRVRIADAKRQGSGSTRQYVLQEALRDQVTPPLDTPSITALVRQWAATMRGIKLQETADGHLVIETKSGQIVEVTGVQQITPDSVSLSIAYGTETVPEGKVIAGQLLSTQTTKKTAEIQLVYNEAGVWTMGHEFYHFLEEIGAISNEDKNLLNRKIRSLVERDPTTYAKLKGMSPAEQRAEWTSRMQPGLYDATTPTGKIIQKIKDVIDQVLNALGIRTAGGVVRDIREGKIYNKTALPGTQQYAKRFAVTDKPGTANIPPETTPKAAGGNPFKDSKVQEAVYHGTNEEFDVFNPDSLGANTMDNATDDAVRALSQVGFWFNSGEIKQSRKSPYSRYKQAYLDLKNPVEYPSIDSIAEEIRPYIEKNTTEDSEWGAEINWKQVIKEWRADTLYDDVDGIIVDDEEFGGKSYVVFSPDQIKNLPNPSRPPEFGGPQYALADRAEQATAAVTGAATRAANRGLAMMGARTSPATREAAGTFAKHWKEFWQPFSTVPNGDKILAKRYEAMGNVGRAVRFIEELFNKVNAYPDQVKKDMFWYLNGDVPIDVLPEDVRETAEMIRRRTEVIGEMLVDRGIIAEGQFEKYRGKYIHYMYAKHVMGEDKPIFLTSTGKLNLSYTKSRNTKLTLQQKKELGLIEDASVAVPTGMGKALTDIAKYDYLQSISENADWVWQPSLIKVPVGKTLTTSIRGRTRRNVTMGIGKLVEEAKTYDAMMAKHPTPEIAEIHRILHEALDKAEAASENMPADFVQLPNSKGYGPLAGAFIRKPIADDLMPVLDIATDRGKLMNTIMEIERQGMAGFKMGKVALNFPTAVRNIISNIIQNNMRGRSLAQIPGDIIAACESMKARNEHYEEAFGMGLFHTNWFVSEINNVLDEFRKVQGGRIDQILMAVKNVAKYYGKIDDVNKLAIFIEQRKAGKNIDEAALEAMKWGMDYSLTSRSIKGLRQTIMPFATYQYKIAPLIAESLKKRPWVLAKFGLIYTAAKMVAMGFNDLDDDDWDDLEKQLPAYIKKSGSMMILPWKTDKGQWQWVNLEYFFPWGNYLAIARDMKAADLGEGLRDAGLSNPFLSMLYTGLSAREDQPPLHSYFGTPIYNQLDTAPVKAAKLMEYMANIWMPSMATRQGAIGYTGRAIVGGEDRWGREVSAGQALGRWFGVNIVSVSPEQTRAQASVRIQDLRKEQSRIEANPSYDEEEKKAYAGRLNEKLAEIAVEAPAAVLPITKAKGKDRVYEALQAMAAKGTLHTAPPSRSVEIAGTPFKMTMEQYGRYIEQTSDIARNRLLPLVESPIWQTMSDKRKAEVVSGIVTNARKGIRQRIKREIQITNREKIVESRMAGR